MKPPETRAGAIITLTTDFGLSDWYVAEMKGVILALNGEAVIVDISHAVRAQRLLQAVFITQAAWPSFPAGTIHVVVVDPGVGTERRAIMLETPRGCFVGPDNGVLSAALPELSRPSVEMGPAPMAPPAGCRAFALTNPRYMREPVSATFHGRDVFAPAAAHLSLGVPVGELGEPVDGILTFPSLCARRRPDGALEGRVAHIDRFGNVITTVLAQQLPTGPIIVELAGQRIGGPVRTYAEATGLAALVGSSGYLEVALPSGSAAEALGVDIEQAVLVRPGR